MIQKTRSCQCRHCQPINIRQSHPASEADLRWLDPLESRVEEIQNQDLPQPELRPRGQPRREN